MSPRDRGTKRTNGDKPPDTGVSARYSTYYPIAPGSEPTGGTGAAPEFLTVAEAAGALHLTEGGVRAAIRRGEVPAVQVGSKYLVPAAWLRGLAARAEEEAARRREDREVPLTLAGDRPWTKDELKSIADSCRRTA